jgi:hypothetical protein
MRRVRLILGLALAAGLVLALPTGVDAARGNKGNRKGQHTIAGTIVSVHHGKGQNNSGGTIKVRVRHRRQNQVALGPSGKKGHGRVVTVRFDQDTKIERIGRGKGTQNGQSLGVDSLHAGEHVRIKLDHGHHAREIDILSRGAGSRLGGKK